MSTITIQQLEGIPNLRRDRLVNSMLAACTQATRKCGSCPHKKKSSPSTCITLLKTVASKHRETLIEEFGLPPNTHFSVFVMGTAVGITAK